MILDSHHVKLYAAVMFIAALGAYGYHTKSLDVATAEAKAKAQETVIAAVEKRIADREAEFKDEMVRIMAMKSTPATTPAQIVERIPQYFPDLHPTMQQPADASKPPQIVFDLPQAKLLNDQLAECKLCSIERDKLKQDLADQKGIIADREKEVAEWKMAARGGSIWKRAGRAAKWLVIGGAIGYAVAKR